MKLNKKRLYNFKIKILFSLGIEGIILLKLYKLVSYEKINK